MAKVVARQPIPYAYDVWKEPHIELPWDISSSNGRTTSLFCYCPKTLPRFKFPPEEAVTEHHVSAPKPRASRKETPRKTPRTKRPQKKKRHNNNTVPRRWGPYDIRSTAWSGPTWTGLIGDVVISIATDKSLPVDTFASMDKRGLLESHVYTQAAFSRFALSALKVLAFAEVVETWGLRTFPGGQERAYLGAGPLYLTAVAACENHSGRRTSRRTRGSRNTRSPKDAGRLYPARIGFGYAMGCAGDGNPI